MKHMFCSNPAVEQYREVQFDGDPHFYLRYSNSIYAPNWNNIGISWYRMNQGAWEPYSQKLDILEERYQECLKQS